MSQFLRLAEFFIVHKVSLVILGEIASLMILSFLPLSLPVAFLIAVLSGFGRLSADSELVALKANGVSIHRMTVPVLISSLLLSLVLLQLNRDWVPWGELAYRDLIVKVGNTKATASLKEGAFTTGFFDLLIYTDRLDQKTNHMYKVFIYDERDPKNPLTVIAQEGEILPVTTSSGLSSAILLKLYNGSINRNDLIQKTFQKINFEEYKLYLTVKEGQGGVSWRPRIIRQNDLLKQIREKDPATVYWKELKLEYWRRFSVAFNPIIFAFLGVGFGTVRTRAVRAGAALVGLVVVIIYWGLQAWMISVGMAGHLLPFWAMMVPNFVILALAIRGYRSALW
jgi:lipopolysaccharide export system permease protein